MPSDQQMRLKSNLNANNISKRGSVKPSLKNKQDDTPVGPILLFFFLMALLYYVYNKYQPEEF